MTDPQCSSINRETGELGEKTMDKVRRFLLIFGMGMIAIPGILFLARISRLRYHNSTGEWADKGMYEKLRESKVALDKATMLIKSALNGRKNGNP